MPSYSYANDLSLVRFMFEVDDYGFSGIWRPAGWRKPSCIIEPTVLLEWLTVQIHSFQNQYPKAGHAVIKRSGNGYHVYFPMIPPMPISEFEKLLLFFPYDCSWAWWTRLFGRATLRISDKPLIKIVKGEFSKQLGTRVGLSKPTTIRIIYPDGKIMYRREIEQKYGVAV